jgi:hypothetical protein
VAVAANSVFLHVGLPKTGTTYIQTALWESRDRLAEAGVLVPGRTRQSTWQAVSDLLGRRPRGTDAPKVEGSGDVMLEAIREWHGDRVILSHELLGTATSRQAQRLVRALGPRDVHVVLTVRDYSRLLPSVWQQEIRKGRTWTWEEFLNAVQDPERGPATAGVAFWLRFDAERILRIWGELIPASNLHVVIVPPPRAAPDALLARFAEATGVDARALVVARPDANTTIGLAETEVLRRLNVALAGSLNEREYTRVVGKGVVPALQERQASTRATLPLDQQKWAAAKSADLVTFLQEHRCQVVGDLADLTPSPGQGGHDADELTDADLVEPMQAALVAVSQAYATFWSNNRRHEQTVSADVSTRAASRARALIYRVRISVLERADDNRVFGSIARTYLKRTSGS